MRMKPDWLNDSSVTEVEVVAKGGYIRRIMVLQPIARGQVARTSHGMIAISGEKNESRIRQSVAYRKMDVITWLNGGYLNRSAVRLREFASEYLTR